MPQKKLNSDLNYTVFHTYDNVRRKKMPGRRKISNRVSKSQDPPKKPRDVSCPGLIIINNNK